MLMQSLLLIAALVAISGTILTSTLVTAKNGFHQAMMTANQTAMSGATADFVAWAASYVQPGNAAAGNAQTHNAQTVWPKQFTTEFKPMCSSQGTALAAPAPCQYYVYAKWVVTGATTAGGIRTAPVGAPPATHVSTVKNLADTVDEQRISATITVDINDPTGKKTFASTSREVTARIFDAIPYVVITGIRDVGTQEGNYSASEGDTGGAVNVTAYNSGNKLATPDPNHPAKATDTRLITSIDCNNSPGVSQLNALLNSTHSVDYSLRPYGNQDWAYEAQCTPAVVVTPPPTITDYIAPIGSSYGSAHDNPATSPWNKNDADISAFAR